MRRKRAALAVLTVLAIAGVGAVSYAARLVSPPDPSATPQIFTIERGAGLSRVAHRLEAEGLVKNATATVWMARVNGLEGSLRAGEFEVSAAQSAGEILETLASGAVVTYPLVLPEGIRASEIAVRLDAAGITDGASFLAVTSDPDFASALGVEADGLEGYLYPETYYFPRGTPAKDVARTLVAQFDRVWTRFDDAANASPLTKHQIVTLASIVEKETGEQSERPLIASVFLNRLKKKMRLETDPTVIYGIPDFDGNLRRRDLENPDNRYNTYRIAGLPPGPIASPGEDALRAVLEPADSDYLYFVSRNDGTHKFSESYRDHVNAVNHFQRRRRHR